MHSLISGGLAFLLLIALCKGINDVIYHIARGRRRHSFIAWVLTHVHFARWCAGGFIGAGIAYLMVVSFIESATAERYSVSVEPPPIYNSYEDEDTEETYDIAEETVAKDKVELKRWVAYAIWYEARGESATGRRAVASVLWNRARKDPQNIMAVLQSTNWLGQTEILNPELADTSCPVYKESWLIANTMVENEFESIGKWTHFYNPAKARPAWGSSLIAKKKIGNHLFGVLPQ